MYRTTRGRVCLHIQKPKPQASIKNKIDKFHKLFDVYNTILNDDGGRAVAIAMLPPSPTKPITLVGEEKNNSTLLHVLKGEDCVTGRSGLRLWL